MTAITFVVTHPDLSRPVEVDGDDTHTDTFITNNVWHYVLRAFDVMVDRHQFTVERRYPEPPDEHEFQAGAEAERQSERLREGWNP